ncbi:TVP38/TMEM64 family protein [Aliidiomarina sp. Khilg15.8]
MKSTTRSFIVKTFFLVLVLGALSLCWRWLVDTGTLDPAQLESSLRALRDRSNNFFLGVTVIVIFVVALQLMFPLTVLVVTAAVLFGPWWGLFYSTVGTLASSATCYWVGRWLGQETLMNYQGRYIRRLSAYMSERSLRTMVVINFLPIAPFTFTNLLAGAVSMHYGRYLVGSAIGIIPGLAAVTLFGAQLTTILFSDEQQEIWVAVAGLVAAVVILLVIKMVHQRRKRARQSS